MKDRWWEVERPSGYKEVEDTFSLEVQGVNLYLFHVI